MNTLHHDLDLRIRRVQEAMQRQGIDALVVSSNVALLYLFGHIYSGVAYVPSVGEAQYFVRRPQEYGEHSQIHYIRKIEQMAEYIDLGQVQTLALELDELPYSEVLRQHNIFSSSKLVNATPLLRSVRMIKTPYEIEAIREGAKKQMAVYNAIKSVYRSGMSDLQLQIEIEHLMRKGGSVGIFRCYGHAMEIHMGSLLSGDNASAGSPYDFALGGSGSPALPIGASGKPLQGSCAIMVDMAGNYGTYLSDITRTYSVGRLSDEAYRLHDLSCRMHHEIMQSASVGTSCGELHTRCLELAEREGAKEYFMGYGQQAQFVGHGLGLQINELPVLTERSKDTLAEGMLIAFEPKFVLPKVGAVGIENTYLVTAQGIENLSPLREEIIDLEA